MKIINNLKSDIYNKILIVKIKNKIVIVLNIKYTCSSYYHINIYQLIYKNQFFLKNIKYIKK